MPSELRMYVITDASSTSDSWPFQATIAGDLSSGCYIAFGGGSLRRMLIRDPCAVVVLGDSIDHDWHESVILTAQLCTLAAVHAGIVDSEPGVSYESRNAVLLHAECRHPPRMDHVAGGDQNPYLLTDRHDERMIHLQQVVFALRLTVLDLASRGRKTAVEADILVQIVVAPLPLVSDDLHGDIRIRSVIPREHRSGGRNTDAHDDEDRNNRPGHFERLVAREPPCLVAT